MFDAGVMKDAGRRAARRRFDGVDIGVVSLDVFRVGRVLRRRLYVDIPLGSRANGGFLSADAHWRPDRNDVTFGQ